MKISVLLPFLILFAFRLNYAQQSNNVFDFIPEPALKENNHNKIISDCYKPLNLRGHQSLIIDLNENLDIEGLADKQSSAIFNNKNFQKHLLPIYDTGKYHSFLPEYNQKSNILVPSAEVMGINLFFLFYNWYILKQDYAKISFKTVLHNLDTGFVWDEDVYHTNQLRHPVQASLYFNAARSTGYSFWKSIPFVFFGSATWEIFLEKDPPQTNDLITSTIGGVSVGEMAYRLSSVILDESKSGSNRIFREIAAAIVNPVRAVNRLIRGEMSRKTPFNVNDVFPVCNRLNFGYAGINGNEDIPTEKGHFMFEYLVTYGSVFENNTMNPFDFFRARIGFDFKIGEQSFFWNNAYGLLYGKNIINHSGSRFVLGVFHGIDYFYNSIYRLSTQSLGIGFIYASPVNNKFKADITLHTNFIPLGAVNSIFRRGSFRDYDFAVGNKTMLEASLSYGPFMLMLESEYYYLKTVEGFPGYANIFFINPKFMADLYNGIGIGAEYLLYRKFGTYENHSDYDIGTGEYRFYLSFGL
jgi:hypothetical protein